MPLRPKLYFRWAKSPGEPTRVASGSHHGQSLGLPFREGAAA
jgi:hypothetical protein